MGAVACRADYVIFTPDNPANDDPKMLTELAKGATHDRYVEFDDREGIKHAIDIVPGDTVVLASKGREPYQIMPGHIKVPHRDDLIGLEAAYKNLAVAQVKIKQLSINDEIVNVYLYIIEDKNQIMLAIPDIFWSIELDLNMDSNDVKEELVMQLFAFIEENEANKIASNLTNWIVNDFKGD